MMSIEMGFILLKILNYQEKNLFSYKKIKILVNHKQNQWILKSDDQQLIFNLKS